MLKFINYTKEAFFWPVHLIGLSILGAITAGMAIFLPSVWGLDPTGAVLVLAGLELTYLGIASNNKRFVRMINRKYSEELKAFYHLREISRHFNSLRTNSQRKYELVRNKLNRVKKNYSNLNKNFPDLVRRYVEKIDGLQLTYVKLLASHDRAWEYLHANKPEGLQRQIQGIQDAMVNDSPEVQSIKKKRIILLQDRLKSYAEVYGKYDVMVAQIKTMDEMINYFVEHSATSRKFGQETHMIDDMISEVSELHQTLSEIETIISGAEDYPQEQAGSGPPAGARIN